MDSQRPFELQKRGTHSPPDIHPSTQPGFQFPPEETNANQWPLDFYKSAYNCRLSFPLPREFLTPFGRPITAARFSGASVVDKRGERDRCYSKYTSTPTSERVVIVFTFLDSPHRNDPR